MDLNKAAEFQAAHEPLNPALRRQRITSINLRLLAMDLPAVVEEGDGYLMEVARDLVEQYRAARQLVADLAPPVDRRIEQFLARHLADVELPEKLQLPRRSFELDEPGLARAVSLPADGDEFISPVLRSYRVRNGVLHNPAADRRTTAGTFHVTSGGLPIPWDKKAVPKRVFVELLRRALRPPEELLVLPFGANLPTPARTWVSLLLRPVVCPEVPGWCPEQTMEVRFFAPGSLVSNLDFVESIFGNAGNPFRPENDAALDVEHWSGHTGCVILAPHLVRCTKKEVGLPHWDDASERQRRDGMCWKDRGELYNDGQAFKLTCRTHEGVIVTLIADNYYGYCKKEVKTQLSYAANLLGQVEEEHAGGALAFASYNLGDEFHAASRATNGRTFADVARDYAGFVNVLPEGYGIDKNYPDLLYIPHDAHLSIPTRRITWKDATGAERSLPLLPGRIYMTPSGYKVRMVKHPGAPSWRLVGTVGEGVFCHKPCTVSGGGKSEISKSLADYMLYGPIFVNDLQRDLDLVQEIFRRDYSTRWRPGAAEMPDYSQRPSRPVLSPLRSVGSVIKLLTPSPDYTDEYNAWLRSVPAHIWPIVFIIKRFARPEWGDDWRRHFSVDIINGVPGHELKYAGRKLVGSYLRVGFLDGKTWRTYKTRQDFMPAAKVQTEDDITATVVVPAALLTNLPAPLPGVSVKFALNCEYRLFQRPDDAIERGLDRQTEADLARPGNFISNFEPLTRPQVREMVAFATELEEFTPPMREFLRQFAEDGQGRYIVSSAQPRLVDGKPSKNPRYLQDRPDLVNPLDRHVAEMGTRLSRAVPADQPVHTPVSAVLCGRRNNPPDTKAGIRGLSAYNPIHYQELPELFMDFICSLTGKSPSTTGAGSEGALTKGPFNAVRTTADLNNALCSYILTGLGGFSTAAGYVGPRCRVDHDISLLVPEIWCRLSPQEQDPRFMIEEGLLEKLEDFDHNGERILASRLGWRITYRFVQIFFGRVFDNPSLVFDEAMLKPETQDLDAFVDSIKNITEAQRRVALGYFEDGSIDEACPPLRALLHIMAHGQYEGKDAGHPDIRAMFTREHLLASDWYRARLLTRQRRQQELWRRHLDYLDRFLADGARAKDAARLDLHRRRAYAAAQLQRVLNAACLKEWVGTLGADPMGQG
jgi:hypothetical protein